MLNQAMNDNTLDNPFWQYACGLYKKPGVTGLLLQLQDEHHWNIPITLFVLWLGKQGVALDDSDIQHFIAVTSEIDNQALHPLRSIRRYMKTCPELSPTLYNNAKELELRVEQVVINLLFMAAPPSSFVHDETSCIPANLSRYASVNGADEALVYKLLELVNLSQGNS